MTVARARTTDPDTSHLAAEHATVSLRENQGYVLEAAELQGPATDEERAEFYWEHHILHNWNPQSPSGLRTRRKELTDSGLMRATNEKREYKHHGLAIVWEVVPEDER